MIKPTVFCDVCGKQKGEVNHWLMAYTDVQSASLTILRWDAKAFASEGNEFWHLCGAECVVKKVNEFLAK